MQADDPRASDKNYPVEGTISMTFADGGLAGFLEFLSLLFSSLRGSWCERRIPLAAD